MNHYTIEDVELIRKKSGISYEEAVNLLEYHNGNMTKAFIDLEKNGKIDDNRAKAVKSNHMSDFDKKKTMNFLQKMYGMRLIVKKDEHFIVNLSLLFSIPFFLIFNKAILPCLALVFILGYRIKIDKNYSGFGNYKLEKMVKNAAQNAKETFSDFAVNVTVSHEKTSEKDTKEKSYYQPFEDDTAPVDYSSPAPQAQSTPVVVHCDKDGDFEINTDSDGYTNVTIG